MARTISERVSEAAAVSFVGRAAERATIASAVAGDPGAPVVLFVHGPGGIGKTRLLRACLADLPEGVDAVALDCRDIEPTPEGFMQGLAAAVGRDAASAPLDPETVAGAVGARGARVVLALDTYESFGLIDTWLRQGFLPALPDHVLVILSGRDAPRPSWFTAPGWGGLVTSIELGALPHSDAMAMLRARGLDELQSARTNRFARGYPLALELAASATRYGAELGADGEPPASAVILRLLDAVCSTLDAETLELLEAASVVRRVNEPILRALKPDASARDGFDRLKDLSFVERRPHGLLLHDVVRDALSRDLAERDPETHSAYCRAAARHFQENAARAEGERLWEVTADLVFMLHLPYTRECCFPPEASEVSVEPARPRDGEAIARIARAKEPEDAARLTLSWWERHPEAFRVARSPAADVAAFECLIDLEDADPDLLDSDPIAGIWRAHLRADPPPAGGRVLLLRRWLGADSGELASPSVSACWLDLKRTYMQLRPDLSRLYGVVGDLPRLAPIFVPLGFAPCGDPVRIGGVDHHPVVLDFGPGSVDGWLARLLDVEIEAGDDDAREPAVDADGPLGTLSARERQVLVLVAEGASNREIGERLIISERTAGRHVANIFTKLGVHRRAEAARIAAEAGLTGATTA